MVKDTVQDSTIYKKGTGKRLAKASRVGSLILDKITPICQQNGFIQARILLEWEYIVTPQFAQFCIPIKVTFPNNQRNNGRLFLRTTSSMATEISYLEPHILNRINQYFGYGAINKISLFQGPIPTKNTPKKNTPIPISDAKHSILEKEVQLIEDDRLRAALLSLGKGIFQEKR